MCIHTHTCMYEMSILFICNINQIPIPRTTKSIALKVEGRQDCQIHNFEHTDDSRDDMSPSLIK